jgi:hypothetical protein
MPSRKAVTILVTFNVGSDDGIMLRDLIAKASAGDPPESEYG